MIIRPIREFLRIEAASGILLLGALVIVLFIANTPLFSWYQSLLQFPVQIRIGPLDLDKPLQLWVNEGLMALFFCLLALEIKREIIDGELSSLSRVTLPVVAALGGMVIPVLIYFSIVHGNPEIISGWAIPTTTDIGLVLGLLALLGKRIPINLKLFLVALSIVDDIAAIVLIAVFYSDHIALVPLLIGFAGIVFMLFMNFKKVSHASAYMIVGLIVWVAVLKSGVHATLAGIAVGFCVPLSGKNKEDPSPLRSLEHSLHPWVAYLIMPVFVFMNAGVPFFNDTDISILHPLPIAVALGLFLGKQFGIFSFAFIAVKLKFAKLPYGCNWWHIYGIAIISGIGFTMSLFIATLAFGVGELEVACRQGILLGSFASALLGMWILYKAGNNVPKADYPIAKLPHTITEN